MIFLLKLLILLCLVKSIFFARNYTNNNGWEISTVAESLRIIGWSLYYDAVTIALVSLPFFLLALFPVKKRWLSAIAIISILLTVLAVLLNLADVFYFPFHRQRADADLLYVLRNPGHYGSYRALLLIVALLLFCCIAAWYFWKEYQKLIDATLSGSRFYLGTALLFLVFISLFTGHSKKLIPSRPLTTVSAVQLPLTQNSFHSFLYSLYRSKASTIPGRIYLPDARMESLLNIHKTNSNVSATPKNVVLFIMESVPYDFFDGSGKFKTALPFLDSLLGHSTFFSNAFSYSYNSNKGITALLTGIPTLTDIPLYHSGFSTINKTAVGKELAQKGYRSSFFIGDNYDDFGFAKCCNWTGIQQYYCMENIPGYQQMEKHSMGLHDEHVLDFMQDKLQQEQEPFFSTFYNISTHYPNDLPKGFIIKTGAGNMTSAMKSMIYYDACLANFFKQAATKKWFGNTVFIFCSDHWASPDSDNSRNDMVNSFRIPVILFDPSVNSKKIVTNTVSQLDIMNTVLAYAGIKEAYSSYGQSLLDSAADKRIVFTKLNSSVYQCIDDAYVLGFDAGEGKRLYCYEYKSDSGRKHNILPGKNNRADSLELTIKAFLQTAYLHYRNKK